jgi:hypothetical protein
MGSLDGLWGLDNFCHIPFLIYYLLFFFISSFYCATISAFKTNDSSLSPSSFFFPLISTFQSSSYFIFSFFPSYLV